MFDPSAMTILTQAAGGSGSWRIWHYVVVDDTTLDDLTEPGYFGAMGDHFTPASVVYVTAPTYVAQLVLSKVGDTWHASVLSEVELPEDAEAPRVQNLPQGSQPITGPTHQPTASFHSGNTPPAERTEPQAAKPAAPPAPQPPAQPKG